MSFIDVENVLPFTAVFQYGDSAGNTTELHHLPPNLNALFATSKGKWALKQLLQQNRLVLNK